MKVGDVSRARRWADPARQRWYAHHRARRFALRMFAPSTRPELVSDKRSLMGGASNSWLPPSECGHEPGPNRV